MLLLKATISKKKITGKPTAEEIAGSRQIKDENSDDFSKAIST